MVSDDRALPPTLATVAHEAGVSRQTVSNALNNPGLLREDTLKRVLDVVEAVGYTPNRAARQLRSGASHLIGLRFEPAHEGTANALMDRFLHTLVDSTRETGQNILLFSGDPDDPLDGYDEVLRSTAVDAFVITDTYSGTPQSTYLQDRKAPFVAFGRPWDDPAADHPWIDVDGAAGVELATRHLVEQGHREIGWLGWLKSSRIGEDRRGGWERAMTAAGLSASLAARTEDDVDAARHEAHTLLDNGVTAFACASDTMAIGALRALAERRLRVGTEVGIVGFDDSAAAQVTNLTSVRQPLEQVAVELVDLLQLVLAGEPTPAGKVLQPTLVVRGSSVRSS